MRIQELPKIERIKRAIKWLIGEGVAQNQEEVGRLLGYGNKSSFSQVINNEGKMPGDFTARLSALSDKLSKTWLDTGEGDMLKMAAPKQEAAVDTIQMPRELFDQITRLTNAVSEQQKERNTLLEVIKSQQRTIETLSKKGEGAGDYGHAAPQAAEG